jgi:hypothetical protein
MRTKATSLFVAIFAMLAILTACTADVNGANHARAETYIRSNISQLSPRTAPVGGTFQVSDIQWLDDDTALVTYEDGHIQLKGRTNVQVNEGSITATRINLEPGYEETGSGTLTGTGAAMSVDGTASVGMSTGMSAKIRAMEGEFCGGIAGIQCADGLTCMLDGSYPDAGGECVRT